LKDHPTNPRILSKKNHDDLLKSFEEFDYVELVAINKDNTILAGHQRVHIMIELGWSDKEIEVRVPSKQLTKKQADEYLIRSNRNTGTWDFDILANNFEMDELCEWGFTLEDFGVVDEDDDGEGGEGDESKKGNVSRKFGYTPFTIFDRRRSDWIERRNYWSKEIGIIDGEGRGESLIGRETASDLMKKLGMTKKDFSGTSLFDPFLAEIFYKWFCVPNGKILDPFSGGCTRGTVASISGFDYTGIDIRKEQIESNYNNFEIINKNNENKYSTTNWICGNSINIDTLVNGKFDFVFSCPPYADLEVYSDIQGDISNMEYNEFIKAYKEIIKKACEKLNDNSFACFVIGEVRDKKGMYYHFVGDTIRAFLDAGLHYYNEAILIDTCGTLALTIGRQFEAGRKLGKQHQNILVFLKGDPKKATKKIGKVSFNIPEDEESQGGEED
jgi:16S rRNA G966 N2-methylase RsmD